MKIKLAVNQIIGR